MDGAVVVVCCKVPDWLREQVPKLLHSAPPQCCSHCPRSRWPTHSLASSPQSNRKFISSTYGLVGDTHTKITMGILTTNSKMTVFTTTLATSLVSRDRKHGVHNVTTLKLTQATKIHPSFMPFDLFTTVDFLIHQVFCEKRLLVRCTHLSYYLIYFCD